MANHPYKKEDLQFCKDVLSKYYPIQTTDNLYNSELTKKKEKQLSSFYAQLTYSFDFFQDKSNIREYERLKAFILAAQRRNERFQLNLNNIELYSVIITYFSNRQPSFLDSPQFKTFPSNDEDLTIFAEYQLITFTYHNKHITI